MFKQISILGSGLLGASLAMSIHHAKIAQSIIIWARRKETVDLCSSKAWCQHGEENLEKSVQGSNLVIICTPVETIGSIVEQIAPYLEKGTLVTDVGSVKNQICLDCEKSMGSSEGVFIGSHPMAGSEKSGMEFASKELVNGKSCIITPMRDDPVDQIQKLEEFWKALKMNVFQFSPREHDRAAAYFSHLPHLLASCLSRHLDTQDVNWKKISGNGLKDTTRIAEGDPQLWQQIFQMNKNKILTAIADFEKSLLEFKELLKGENKNELQSYLKIGSNFRKELDK
ncbi:MAG: prephenate dehydrogenase [Opitutales bacterium]|nr:prephenate dehydrogenase [Opitutales bacterium]